MEINLNEFKKDLLNSNVLNNFYLKNKCYVFGKISGSRSFCMETSNSDIDITFFTFNTDVSIMDRRFLSYRNNILCQIFYNSLDNIGKNDDALNMGLSGLFNLDKTFITYDEKNKDIYDYIYLNKDLISRMSNYLLFSKATKKTLEKEIFDDSNKKSKLCYRFAISYFYLKNELDANANFIKELKLNLDNFNIYKEKIISMYNDFYTNYDKNVSTLSTKFDEIKININKLLELAIQSNKT
jgi:hypothetical protein